MLNCRNHWQYHLRVSLKTIILKIEHRFTQWNKVKFELLLNIDNTIPRGERIKTDFRRLAFEVIRDTPK